MTDKEFRQLKRTELIDIIYEYQKREKLMQREIRKLKAKLQDKTIKIQEAGSIAQASLELNGVFEAAQKAADEYLEQISALKQETDQKCSTMLDDAQKQADQIIARARMQAAAYTGEESFEFPLDLTGGYVAPRDSVAAKSSGEDDDGSDDGDLEFIDLDLTEE